MLTAVAHLSLNHAMGLEMVGRLRQGQWEAERLNPCNEWTRSRICQCLEEWLSFFRHHGVCVGGSICVCILYCMIVNLCTEALSILGTIGTCDNTATKQALETQGHS